MRKFWIVALLALMGCGHKQGQQQQAEDPSDLREYVRYSVTVEMEVIANRSPSVIYHDHQNGTVVIDINGTGQGRLLSAKVVNQGVAELPAEAPPPDGKEPVEPIEPTENP